MSRCTTPIPPLPPSEVLTTTTCASAEVGQGGIIEPSVCACPDNLFLYTNNNTSYFFDYWWNGESDQPKRYLIAMEVNNDGKFYDQVLFHYAGECQEGLNDRIEYRVFNLSGRHSVSVLKFDLNGNLVKTLINYDATAEFNNGNTQWVIFVSEPEASLDQRIRAFINNVAIGNDVVTQQYSGSFMELRRSQSIVGQQIPFGMWVYQQSVEQCLTSGNYNGFGGCSILDQKDALLWDRGLTDINIDLVLGDRVMVPKTGTPTRRTAYLTHPKTSGRVYWEMVRSTAAACASQNYAVGGVEPGVVLNGNDPGSIQNTWGLIQGGGTLQSDGNTIISDLFGNTSRLLFGYDVETAELWYGWETSPGNTTWGGGYPPETGTGWVLFPTRKEIQIVSSPIEYAETMHVLSSAQSCRYPAPPTFDYLV